MANHVIIGLGGTGGRVLRAFRKSISQEFDKVDPEIEDLKLSYLYVDSSEEMMAIDDPSWVILGRSVQLPAGSRLSIKGADLGTKINNISAFPGIKHWIGRKDQWLDILGSAVQDVVGGQKRRLGRFLFACNAKEYMNRVSGLVQDIERNGQQGVDFHILAGLGGGTGAGSLIDAICLIRSKYTDVRNYRICLYLYLPEEHPKAGWDTGNYHLNGYAALLELNALATGKWVPHDVTGEMHHVEGAEDQKGRYVFSSDDPGQPACPFTGCYLYTNVNENGTTPDVQDQLPSIMADFLFQRVVTAKGEARPAFLRVENNENRSDVNETARASNDPVRTKRFLTFGIKRLVIPDSEIREHLTYRFAYQAALQFRCNNWRDGQGFVNEHRNTEYRSYFQTRDNQAKVLISDEHLTLGQGILESDRKNAQWRMTLPDEWKQVSGAWKDTAQQAANGRWLDAIEARYIDRFDKTFRRQGVKPFYETRLAASAEMASEIRRKMEEYLLTEWATGAMSAEEMQTFVAHAIDSIETRAKQFPTQIAQLQEAADRAQQLVDGNKTAWANKWILADLFGKGKKLLDATHLHLDTLYVAKTQILGLQFAVPLCNQIVTSLQGLSSELGTFVTTLSVVSETFRKEAEARCQPGEEEIDYRANVIRFYNQKAVREAGKTFVEDRQQQQQQASELRRRVIESLGGLPSLVQLNKVMTAAKMKDLFEPQCQEQVAKAHQAMVDSRERSPLFGVNILGQLAAKYPDVGSLEFRMFVDKLVKQSRLFMKFDQNEVSITSRQFNLGSSAKSDVLLIILPGGPDHKEFREALEKAFKHCDSTVQFANSEKTNEIVLIRLASCFPLRYAEIVNILRKRYDLKLATSNADRVRLEVHTEGTGREYLPLFLPDDSAVRRDSVKWLLLAKAFGMVEAGQDGAGMQLVTYDEIGLARDPLELGDNLVDAYGRIDSDKAEALENEVKRKLGSADRAVRDRATQTLVKEVNQIKADRRATEQDAVYRLFRDQAKVAVEMLSK